MPWNEVSPSGSISVQANRARMNENTTYIQNTMGNQAVGTNTSNPQLALDHFWNIGSNEDGRHRFIQSPGFTVGGVSTDPFIANGMDGVIYLKQPSVAVGRIEGFYRNTQGIYQFIPSFVSGTKTVTSSFTTLFTAPASVYGEIFMFRLSTNGIDTISKAVFKSSATGLGVAALTFSDNSGDPETPLIFDRSGLIIQVKANDASSGNDWEYRITYRAV